MEKDNSFSKGIVIGMLTTVMVVLILLGIGMATEYITIGRQQISIEDFILSSDNENAEKNNLVKKATSKLGAILKIMDAYYLEEYDEDKMLDGMLAGMLAAVGDPYTAYYDEESYASLMESSEGVYYGIGVVVSQNIETGEVYVVNPYRNCPGDEAGMLPGDIIYTVAGVEVTGMDLNEVVAMIRGEAGSRIDVEVIHEGSVEPVKLSVERRQIEVQTVEYEVLEDNIGYIQITQFDDVTTQQFKIGMEALKSKGIEGIIVDLRDNPGGSLSTVLDILDTVLPKGIYTYLVDKNNNRENYKGTHAAIYDYPMVVLVNENSASASELFTGAVHDYERGTIVGTTTFGKGIVQQIFPLKDGTGIKVTMAKYYTPNGVCIHKTGIEPDVFVELDEGEYPSQIKYEEDEQLQKAVEVIKTKMN